ASAGGKENGRRWDGADGGSRRGKRHGQREPVVFQNGWVTGFRGARRRSAAAAIRCRGDPRFIWQRSEDGAGEMNFSDVRSGSSGTSESGVSVSHQMGN